MTRIKQLVESVLDVHNNGIRSSRLPGHLGWECACGEAIHEGHISGTEIALDEHIATMVVEAISPDLEGMKEARDTVAALAKSSHEWNMKERAKLTARAELAEARIKVVEKLLENSEEVERIYPSQHDRIWINCVRAALGGKV